MPRGLTDIHCHILPYVDDGSDDEDETRDLIAMQSRQGVDRIIITPHLREGMFETSQRQVDMEFDRLGVFTYSQEEDTPAAEYPDQVPEELKEERRDEIMEMQQEIAFEKAASMVGTRLDVIIEGRIPEEGIYVGRTYMDAPNVDSQIYLRSDLDLISGTIVHALVTDAVEYDLKGVIEDESAE